MGDIMDRKGVPLDARPLDEIESKPPTPPPPRATITVRVPTDEIEAAITRLRAEADRVNALAGETSGGVEFAALAQELQRVRAERDALRARSLGPKGEEALSALWRLAHAAAQADASGQAEDRRYADRLWDQLYGYALVLGVSDERNGDQRTDLAPQARRAAEILLLATELSHARAGHRETWLPAAAREAERWQATFLSRLDALYDEAEAAMDEAERAADAAERKARAAITAKPASGA